MPSSFTAATRDSLSNLAASLGVGKDKAAQDAFFVFDLDRAQIEAMYRGDWLARKVVDIVPYDMVRAWRAWSGHRADVDRIEAAERRLGLRKAVQRAMTLGRLHGGGAIVIGDGEPDPAKLAQPLDERLPRGGLAFLHAVSRWQLGASSLDGNPLSPWCGGAGRLRACRRRRGAAAAPPVAGGALPRQPAARPVAGGDALVRLGAAGALRRRARRGADDRGCHEPDARGQGRRRHGAEPVGAPHLHRDDGTALRPLRLCGGDEVDQQPALARRRRDLGAAEDRLRRSARDGADLPAGRGGCGRHPRHAAARAIAVGAVGDGRERRPERCPT